MAQGLVSDVNGAHTLPALASSPSETVDLEALAAQMRELTKAQDDAVDPSPEEIEQVLEAYAKPPSWASHNTRLNPDIELISRRTSNVTSSSLLPWRRKSASGSGRRRPSSSSWQLPRYGSDVRKLYFTDYSDRQDSALTRDHLASVLAGSHEARTKDIANMEGM